MLSATLRILLVLCCVSLAACTSVAERRSEAKLRKAADINAQLGSGYLARGDLEQAKAKLDKMRTKWLEAMESGKISRGLDRVGVEEWRNATLEKGVSRFGSGVNAAEPKMAAFNEELYSYEENAQAEIAKMPDVTPTDTENRMLAWSRKMRQFKRSGR